MRIRKIILHPDVRLRQECSPVGDPTDARIAEIAADLERLRSDHQGLGLAAPQLGELVRMFVLRGWPDPFVNPELAGHGDVRATGPEGCLSIPGVVVPVARWTRVKLRATSLAGVTRTFKLRGLDAVAAQHELDHLDGKLILDYRAVAA